jgi:hypothetical protein
MGVNTDDIKAEEEGERGQGGGLSRRSRGRSPDHFLCSPPIEFGEMGKPGLSHSKCRISSRCSSSSGTN